MELGIIGLGKIGGNLALQCVERGIQVVGKARGPKPELSRKGVKVAMNYKDFVGSLKPPRVIYLSLPAGPTIDKVLGELLPQRARLKKLGMSIVKSRVSATVKGGEGPLEDGAEETFKQIGADIAR